MNHYQSINQNEIEIDTHITALCISVIDLINFIKLSDHLSFVIMMLSLSNIIYLAWAKQEKALTRSKSIREYKSQ